MRTIEYNSHFKRVRKDPHRRALEADFAVIIKALASRVGVPELTRVAFKPSGQAEWVSRSVWECVVKCL
jgi:hypothetical protein